MIKRKHFNKNPLIQFQNWYEDAEQAGIKLPDAMTLATASRTGVPSARIVLFKGIDENGLKFFTNYRSKKAKDLEENPQAEVVFYWPQLDRQVRIQGKIKRTSQKTSDEYWESRPRESRLAALCSSQSTLITGREILENKFNQFKKKYEEKPIPRPEHWGGYLLIARKFEFWINGAYRLHDRFCYRKKAGKWELVQLSP